MTLTYSILTGTRQTDGSIKNWVNNGLVPATTILTEAEAEIYKRLRVRQMLIRTTGTLALAASSISLPSDYRSLFSFMFTGVDKDTLRKRLIWQIEEMWQYDSDGNRIQEKPRFYAASESDIEFDTEADQAYLYQFRYYGAGAALAELTNETNFLTSTYPTMLRYACLYRAFEHLRNTKERTYYKTLMESEIFTANQESDLELMGADLVMTTDGDYDNQWL